MKEHEEEDVIDLWLPLQPRAGKKDKVQGKIHVRFLYSCSAVSILTSAVHSTTIVVSICCSLCFNLSLSLRVGVTGNQADRRQGTADLLLR